MNIFLKRKENVTTVNHTFDKEGNKKKKYKQQIVWIKRRLLNKQQPLCLLVIGLKISLKLMKIKTIWQNQVMGMLDF